MTYVEFASKWEIASSDSKRIDNIHPLNFYLSKDEYNNYKLLFIGGKKKVEIRDSDVIKVATGKRYDGRVAYSFVLTDKNFTNQFFRLCYDLIDSSRGCKNNEESYNFVLNLFIKWQKMMKSSSNNILSQEKVKGLIAELIILYDELQNNNNILELINAWKGPEGYYQDFIFFNTWFEIKAISKRSEKITISSIEQLDVCNDGKLFTVQLDKIDNQRNNSITLNKIVKMIEEKLNFDINLFYIFRDKLTSLGYVYSEEYDKLIYEIGNITIYLVDKNFPRIRRYDISNKIGKVKYEIILSTINKWSMGDMAWNYGNIERIS